jgi:hypothetical protein
MQEIYRCELCGAEFTGQQICLDHESAHVRPAQGKLVQPIEYIPENNNAMNTDPRPYPMSVHIEMTNGSIVAYEFSYVVESE